MGWMAVSPRKLSGTLRVQPSKSAAHRALCCAALAGGVSVIDNIALSDDVRATLDGLRALGLVSAQAKSGRLRVTGGLVPPDTKRRVDCMESGSTLRFLLPMALIGGGPATFLGRGRLMRRPMDVYSTLFESRGIGWKSDGNSITVSGALTPGVFRMPGNVSSQFLTGLLFVLPVLGRWNRAGTWR